MLEPNNKLRLARQLKHWSQERAAAEIGVDRKTYVRWENGLNYPQSGTLDLLCKAFDLPTEDLGFSDIFQRSSPRAVTHNLEPVFQSVPSTGMSDVSTQISLKLAQILHMMSIWGKQGFFYSEIQTMIDEEIRMLDETLQQQQTREDYRISRRQALATLAALPTAVLTWKQPGQSSVVVPEEFLPQCAASITACWHLLKGDGLVAVEQILPKYVPTLTNLALQSSQHQQMAAYLAAQANILQAITAMHRLNIAGREKYCQTAIQCGYLSKDPKITAAALMYLGYTYSFCYRPRRPAQAIQKFLEALRVLGEEDSLIRSDIMMGLAEAYAQCREESNALKYITLAQNHFPTYPDSDPSFLYAECGLNVLYQWEGKMYLELGEHYRDRGYQQKAWDAIVISAGTQSITERATNETIIYQADAARLLGDLTTYTEYVREGTQMALVLGSQKRFDEAHEVYQKTPESWRGEQAIKVLAKEFFRHLPMRRGTS